MRTLSLRDFPRPDDAPDILRRVTEAVDQQVAQREFDTLLSPTKLPDFSYHIGAHDLRGSPNVLWLLYFANVRRRKVPLDALPEGRVFHAHRRALAPATREHAEDRGDTSGRVRSAITPPRILWGCYWELLFHSICVGPMGQPDVSGRFATQLASAAASSATGRLRAIRSVIGDSDLATLRSDYHIKRPALDWPPAPTVVSYYPHRHILQQVELADSPHFRSPGELLETEPVLICARVRHECVADVGEILKRLGEAADAGRIARLAYFCSLGWEDAVVLSPFQGDSALKLLLEALAHSVGPGAPIRVDSRLLVARESELTCGRWTTPARVIVEIALASTAVADEVAAAVRDWPRRSDNRIRVSRISWALGPVDLIVQAEVDDAAGARALLGQLSTLRAEKRARATNTRLLFEEHHV